MSIAQFLDSLPHRNDFLTIVSHHFFTINLFKKCAKYLFLVQLILDFLLHAHCLFDDNFSDDHVLVIGQKKKPFAFMQAKCHCVAVTHLRREKKKP